MCAPQIGGAKAGLCFDHEDPRAKDVLRRFLIWAAPVLGSVWVTAGDLNTDDAFIERVIQESLGLPTCQATLGRLFAKATGTRDRSSRLAQLITAPASPYFPLIEGAVGYGMAAAVLWALMRSAGGPKARVAIQGFGAVGSSLACYLHKLGIAVVAISDKDGYYCRPEGIDVERLLLARKLVVTQLRESGATAEVIVEHAKNLCCNLRAAAQLKSASGAPLFDAALCAWEPRPADNEAFLCTLLRAARATVFCPCAGRYQVTRGVVACLAETGCQWLVSGANNPFGAGAVEDPSVEQLCFASGICVVPDWVANSGTAQLFHRGLSVDFDMRSPTLADAVLEACAAPIRSFLDEALAICERDTLHLAMGCRALAKRRLDKPIPFVAERVPNRANSRYALPPMANPLPLAERLALCQQVGCEIVELAELEELLRTCPNAVCYDGFEPSGRMHIAQGLMKAINVNRLTAAGFTYVFWIADWFAKMNLKFDGDLDKIRVVGRYFIEVWRACGMNMDRVVFLWCADEIAKHHDDYWAVELDIATKFSVKRIERCGQIMGRGDKNLQASQVQYPLMQATDIFFIGVDVCQLGLDQRKVNMLAREYAEKVGKPKPIVLSHAMLPGLKQAKQKPAVAGDAEAAADRAIANKMSKSDPSSAVFMEDGPDEVEAKIKAAYCPPQQVEDNPCLAYMQHIVLPKFGSVDIARASGAMLTVSSFDVLAEAYRMGTVDFADLKAALIKYLNLALEPVREHFRGGEPKALLDQVKALQAAQAAQRAKQ